MTHAQDEGLMTVGGLSKRTGMSARLIRRFTDVGLIYSPGRSAAGYRLYDESALWCVDVISKLRALGLTIKEIQRLGDVYLHHTDVDVRDLFEQLLGDARRRLDSRISRLEEVKIRQDRVLIGRHDGEPAFVFPQDPTRG